MRLTIFEDRDINMLDKVLNGVLDIASVESYAYHLRCIICGCHPSSICSSPAAKTHGWPPYRDAACSPEAPLDIDADWAADDLFICPSVKAA